MKTLLYACFCFVFCSCAFTTPASKQNVVAGNVVRSSGTQTALAQDKRYRSLIDSINPDCSCAISIDGKPVQVRDGSVITMRGKDGRFVPMTVKQP